MSFPKYQLVMFVLLPINFHPEDTFRKNIVQALPLIEKETSSFILSNIVQIVTLAIIYYQCVSMNLKARTIVRAAIPQSWGHKIVQNRTMETISSNTCWRL